jgi:hypothetical protein
MRYRKPRIAWSVAWGVAAVLLCVLWVRSYSWRQTFNRLTPNELYQEIASDSGRLSLQSQYQPFADVGPIDWEYEAYPPTFHEAPGFWFVWHDNEWSAVIPHWFAMLFTLVLGVLPWLRWRFSLRSLLVATTLVSVLLGLIVWAAKS